MYWIRLTFLVFGVITLIYFGTKDMLFYFFLHCYLQESIFI